MLEKSCLQCSSVFFKPLHSGYRDWDKRKFCGLECRNIYNRLYPNSGTFKKGIKILVPPEKRRRGSANNKWKGGQVELTCKICLKQFLVDKYRSKAKCCSRICSNLLRSTPEHRLALSQTQRAKVPPQHVFIRSFTSLLKTCSKYSMWREKILKRDNFTCQICFKRGGKLQVDHINPFIKIILDNKIEDYNQALECLELWDMTNGRTLCPPCHYETPTFGSKVLSFIKS